MAILAGATSLSDAKHVDQRPSRWLANERYSQIVVLRGRDAQRNGRMHCYGKEFWYEDIKLCTTVNCASIEIGTRLPAQATVAASHN